MAAMSGGRRPAPPSGYRLPEIFPSLDHAKRISIDLESVDPSIAAGKGPGWRRDAYIVGFSLAIGDKKGGTEWSDYFPVRHKSAPNLDEDRIIDWLTTELAFFSGEVVGANLLYDFDGFGSKWNLHAPLAKFRDIQFAEPLLDENAFSYQLKALAKKYLGEGKVTEELKKLYGEDFISRFHEVHPGHARAYGLGDVELPLRILHEQSKQLRKEGLDDLFDLECRLIPFLLYMRKIGTRVDLNKAASISAMLGKRRDSAIEQIASMSGVSTDYDNFGKPTVMKSVFDRLNIAYPYLLPGDVIVSPGDPNYEEAKTSGKPSFRNLWLEHLEHPVAELIQIANKCEKAKGTFVDGYITDNAIGDRVHCEFHPLRKKKDEHSKSQGTITGRFSSSNPNLQNIPSRDDEIGPICRSMFIPDDGCDWFSADYSQIEYRYLIHWALKLKCTGAEIPQRMYNENPKTDFHDACAKLMYSKDWNDAIERHLRGEISEKEMKVIHKKLRKPAKNLNFGNVYGQGVAALALLLGEVNADGTANEKSLQIMREYHAAAPYIKDLNEKCIKEVSTERAGGHYITTILNRRGRFVMFEPKKYPEKGAPRATPLPYEQAVSAWGGADKIKVTRAYKALNTRLQGSAADQLKQAMVNIWESGVLDEGVRVQLTVHDELDGSVERTERARKALKEMVHLMETAIPLHIPVVVSCEVGESWAETH
jgi:DNA polymerase I-like protein with 3'-5' exonuclease and polymerase domains